MEFYEKWIPVPIEFLAHCDADPAFTDAVLFNVCFFRSVEADADLTLQNIFVVVRALGIDAKPVR